ncbi:MAG: flagellar basal body L-ring protein FlgH [Candidatus Acidiferrales bacterium]
MLPSNEISSGTKVREGRSGVPSVAVLAAAIFFAMIFSAPRTVAQGFVQGIGQATKSKIKSSLKKTPEQDALDQYLARARMWYGNYTPTTGSLWNPNGPLADIGSDTKAHNLGDMITIQLVEVTTASQQGAVQTQRTLSASSNISALFGVPGARSALQNIFSPNSSQNLNGKGQATLQTSFSTTLTGNVVELLPNGYMVIQAARDINVSNQKQTMTLRGIVRRADISPTNVVLSSAISQMEVSLQGKGVISEGTRPPNVVVRFLLRVLGF